MPDDRVALSLLMRDLARLPLGGGLQVIPAASLVGSAPAPFQGRWTGATGRLLNAQLPLVVTAIADPDALREVVRALRARYPTDHHVTLGDGEGRPLEGDMEWTLGTLLDNLPVSEGPFSLHVPPLAPLDDPRALETLGYLTARLRAPDGCPWDRGQTPVSLTPYMIEEAHEAVDAIERADDADIVEELGDVLLQVVFHSQIAEEEDRFTMADVAEAINRKLVRRHPHVFGDVAVGSASEVVRNWDAIKREEKGERRTSILDDIPVALPALLLAQTVGRKTATAGFDWKDAAGPLAKVHEELAEVQGASTDAARRDELGDLLFALTSLCRHLGVDAEGALRDAVRKFERRFRWVEERARELDLRTVGEDRLDDLWRDAKRAEP